MRKGLEGKDCLKATSVVLLDGICKTGIFFPIFKWSKGRDLPLTWVHAWSSHLGLWGFSFCLFDNCIDFTVFRTILCFLYLFTPCPFFSCLFFFSFLLPNKCCWIYNESNWFYCMVPYAGQAASPFPILEFTSMISQLLLWKFELSDILLMPVMVVHSAGRCLFNHSVILSFSQGLLFSLFQRL